MPLNFKKRTRIETNQTEGQPARRSPISVYVTDQATRDQVLGSSSRQAR